MFGKLFKYELKSIGKWYFALNVSIIAIAVILSFTFELLSSKVNETHPKISWTTDLLPMILTLIFGFLIAGSLLATLLIIIRRFNQNVFGREGYLTMTLPVSEHHLILSKLLASFICMIFNSFILVIATLILIIPQVSVAEFLNAFRDLGQLILENLDLTGFGISYLLLSTFSGILMIYLSISIGQLFANRRGLKAFIAYAVITVLITILFSQINTNLFRFDFNETMDLDFLRNRYMYVLLGETVIELVTFYFATHFIMKHKLNLQ
ncbi:hypothetical protein [Streptococcus iniae]|uniref:hypothetical protein n=1 Tax=Streptococcus iniae TaxID=1346 RepID=UPI0003183909|nr:hypothetical protein [Streptococcus iniae]